MSEKINIEELTEGAKAYIQTNIQLFKLEATERTSLFGAKLMSTLIVGTVILLFILFLSISTAFFLGNYFNDLCTGFAIVTGFYFVLSLFLIIGRKRCIEKPVRNSIIRRILSK